MFSDYNIAESSGVTQLNSTAVANASSEMNGSVVECMAGPMNDVNVGNVSVCVIGKLI